MITFPAHWYRPATAVLLGVILILVACSSSPGASPSTGSISPGVHPHTLQEYCGLLSNDELRQFLGQTITTVTMNDATHANSLAQLDSQCRYFIANTTQLATSIDYAVYDPAKLQQFHTTTQEEYLHRKATLGQSLTTGMDITGIGEAAYGGKEKIDPSSANPGFTELIILQGNSIVVIEVGSYQGLNANEQIAHALLNRL